MQGTVRAERGEVMAAAAVRERELERQVSALRASSSEAGSLLCVSVHLSLFERETLPRV